MSDLNIQYKNPTAAALKNPPGITRCSSDADKEKTSLCSSPPTNVKISVETATTGSNEIIDVFKTLPRRLLPPKKQLTVENDDDVGKLNGGPAMAKSGFEPASRFLKPSGAAQNYKLNRRRSKTYSGEELAAELERLNQLHQHELNSQNRKIFSTRLFNSLLSGGGSSNGGNGSGGDLSAKNNSKSSNNNNTNNNNNNVNASAIPLFSHFNIPPRRFKMIFYLFYLARRNKNLFYFNSFSNQ
jgi:hypothetical protein